MIHLSSDANHGLAAVYASSGSPEKVEALEQKVKDIENSLNDIEEKITSIQQDLNDRVVKSQVRSRLNFWPPSHEEGYNQNYGQLGPGLLAGSSGIEMLISGWNNRL